MAKDTPATPWFVDMLPLLVVLIIGIHVFGLVYWIYKLATQKTPQRRKTH